MIVMRINLNQPRHRRGASLARLAAVLLAAAACLLGAGAAGASAAPLTISNSATVSLGGYGIPSSPPKYQPGGDLLPTANGALGNAAILGLTGINQAVGVQNGSKAWDTPVTTADLVNGSGSQRWYFERVGWVGAYTPLTEGDGISELQQLPVYRVINYNGSSHTCLDAEGATDTPYTKLDSYGCDPNATNQTNQLWVVSGRWHESDVITADGELDANGDYIMGTVFNDALDTWLQGATLESLGALIDAGFHTERAPVVTAGYANIRGYDSQLILNGATTWPTDVANARFTLIDADAGEQAPSEPGCVGMACLLPGVDG
jgi:hypothetical protein